MKQLLFVFAAFILGLSTLNAQTKITIESNDQMKYNLSTIKVKAGQSVTLTLKHVGKMPKQAMGHNWVLLQIGTDIPTFAQSAQKASGTNYVPSGNKAVLASTKVIGGGEQVTITFTAPKKGTYPYICSFPGHFSMMKGNLISE